MTPRPAGRKGMVAAHALAQVMSGEMLTGMALVIGPPGYDPIKNELSLPGVPADDLPDALNDRLIAYLGHEAAERGLSTWMPTDPRWATKPGLKVLVNALNDARIDLAQSAAYPGFGMKMRVVRAAQLAETAAACRSGENASFGRLAELCVFLGEGLLTYPQALHRFPAWAKFLRRGAAVLAHLDVSTEARCIEQASALYQLLKQSHQSSHEPSQATDPSSEASPATPCAAAEEYGPCRDADSGTSVSDDNARPVGRLPGRTGDDEPDGSAAAAPGKTAGGGTSVDEPETVDDGEQLRETKNAPTVQDSLLNDVVKEMFHHHASNYIIHPETTVVQTAEVTGPRLTSTYMPAAQVLEQHLRQVLTAPGLTYTSNRETGELDERAIGRFIAGDTHVFRRRIKQESDSVACTVSWDQSGSMRHSRIQTVALLVHVWNAALGRLGIPTELLGWESHQSVNHTVYKTFTERWNHPAVLGRLPSITTRGSTPMGEALLFAAERLGRRPEARRVLFFLTDGHPNGGAGEARLIKTVVRRCDTAGVELVGIGIKVTLAHLFPRWVQVDDLAHLRTVAVRELADILRTTHRTVR